MSDLRGVPPRAHVTTMRDTAQEEHINIYRRQNFQKDSKIATTIFVGT